MKVTVESKKGLKTNLKVFIDKKTIDEKISVRLIELSKTINLKGFRPGKIPIDVLKRQFGKAVYGEVLENILKETSSKAIEEKKIKIAGQPKLDLKSHGEGKDLNYTLEIDELPSIKLESMDKVKFTDYIINVTQEETDKKIEEISKNQNSFKDKKEGQKIFSNNKTAFVEYVQDMTETTMPSFFIEALVAKVSTEINEAITASGSLTQRLANDFQQKLRAARIADGQENPPQNIMPAGRLIEAHLNGSTSDRFRHEQS